MQTILSLLTPLIAFVLGVWFFIATRKRDKQADDNAQAATAIEAVAWDRFRTLLKDALPWLCTQAEIALGGGTGELKQGYVITEALKLLPDSLRNRMHEDLLITYIKAALDAAKDVWAEAPALFPVTLLPELIEAEAPAEKPAPKPRRKKRPAAEVVEEVTEDPAHENGLAEEE